MINQWFKRLPLTVARMRRAANFFSKVRSLWHTNNFYFIQNWSSFSKAAWSQYAVLCAGSAKRSYPLFYQFNPGRFILFNPIFSFNWFRLIPTVWSSASFISNFNSSIILIYTLVYPIQHQFDSQLILWTQNKFSPLQCLGQKTELILFMINPIFIIQAKSTN